MAPFDPMFWSEHFGGLMLTFDTAVDYVSLLAAELTDDAGAAFDDPVRWWVYDYSIN